MRGYSWNSKAKPNSHTTPTVLLCVNGCRSFCRWNKSPDSWKAGFASFWSWSLIPCETGVFLTAGARIRCYSFCGPAERTTSRIEALLFVPRPWVIDDDKFPPESVTQDTAFFAVWFRCMLSRIFISVKGGCVPSFRNCWLMYCSSSFDSTRFADNLACVKMGRRRIFLANWMK